MHQNVQTNNYTGTNSYVYTQINTHIFTKLHSRTNIHIPIQKTWESKYGKKYIQVEANS